MNYKNEEHSIKWLIELIETDTINLRPPYQRNFIWSPKDQKSLIDSIHYGFPLPNFFILKNADGTYEMVDGQQRATTIYKYYKNEFKDNDRNLFENTNQEKFLEYKLNVVVLDDLKEGVKENFFSLVNKRGIHLNNSELNQAQYHDSDFLQLVNKIMNLQELIELDIFTDKNQLRMNDRGSIEEIVAYLFYNQIYDKRSYVDQLFKSSISNEKKDIVYQSFVEILKKLTMLNQIKPINETRYKQRNDFFTLICFINNNLEEDINLLKMQYEFLVFISDNGFISPSNESCTPFKEYALNCVSQSNSKKARDSRLQFLTDMLCHNVNQQNVAFDLVVEYISFEYGSCPFVQYKEYKLIDTSKLK